MKESAKHMLQGAVVTLAGIAFCIGVGFTVGQMQKSAKQEMQTSPRLAEVKKAQVITTTDDGERVQTQENHSPVPVTTFCFRHTLYMQVNQGNATWGSPVYDGKPNPERC